MNNRLRRIQCIHTNTKQNLVYTIPIRQSWVMPPASDRYSVAGASSHSGSGAHVEHQKHRNIKEKAKELRNAVHHSLRNGLGECQCQSCYDRKFHEKNI